MLLSVYIKENPNFLKIALQSIYEEQTLKPCEIVLVKDGPLTIELEKVISDYQKKIPKILNIIALKENKGLGFALNKGLEVCSNELVARMDTDDIATPDRFDKQISFMLDNECVDVSGGMLEEFELLPGDLKQYRSLPENHEDIVKFAKFRNPINHPTVVYKKSKVLKLGGYKTDVLFWEDYLLWIEMLNKGYKFHNLAENILHFRVQEGNKMIEKRRGLKYALNELEFARYAKDIGFFSFKEYIKYILLKPIGRVLPTVIIANIYSVFFREKNF